MENAKRIAAVDEITEIRGVLNGTCNYILTKMEEGMSYEDALSLARREGFAEEDPTDDVGGFDTMRKIRILATVLTGRKVSEESIDVSGIEDITPEMMEEASFSGRRYRLIGSAIRENDEIRCRVEADSVDVNSPEGSLKGSENVITLKGKNCGLLVYKGMGAGKRPTAFSLLSDLLSMYEF